MEIIQSFILSRDFFTLEEAIEYMDEENYKKIEVTPQYYKFVKWNSKHLKDIKGLKDIKIIMNKKNGIGNIIYYNKLEK